MTTSKLFPSAITIFVFFQNKVQPTGLLHTKGYFLHSNDRENANFGLCVLQVGKEVISPCLQTVAATPAVAVKIDAYLEMIRQFSEDVKQFGILSAETL
jgi:hypothetical protein